jgi:hypothetical protein
MIELNWTELNYTDVMVSVFQFSLQELKWPNTYINLTELMIELNWTEEHNAQIPYQLMTI